jgi:hypothetical protein
LNNKRLDDIDEKVYELPQAVHQDLIDAYRTMATEALREAEAQEWAEATVQDFASMLQQDVRRKLPKNRPTKDDPTRRHL